MKRYDQAEYATKKLADFYREALSGGKDLVTLEDEFAIVKHYLSIQKIRYSEVFDYEISADDELLCTAIPKLTLQPLIENCIYHGLKTREGKGLIVLEAFRHAGTVIVSVKDNGKGINREKLSLLLRREGSRQDGSSSFGVFSVDERLRLYFGEEYGLRITSEEGQGTEVTIQLPTAL